LYAVLSQFIVIPPSIESTQEVRSYVRPATQFRPINIEASIVVRQEHRFNLAPTRIAATHLGTQHTAQKLGKNADENRGSKENAIALP
jgi:hypothetical protein